MTKPSGRASRDIIFDLGLCFSAITSPEKSDQGNAVTDCVNDYGSFLPIFSSLNDLENMKTTMMTAFGTKNITNFIINICIMLYYFFRFCG